MTDSPATTSTPPKSSASAPVSDRFETPQSDWMTSTIDSTPFRTPRVKSIDALRGFDMLWLIGASAVVVALHGVINTPFTAALATQMEHVDWEGFRFYDLIFPLFVFVTGMSLVFSLKISLEREGRARTIRKIVIRSILLFLLGVLYNGGMANGLDRVRLPGVLQRIAIAYLCTGILFCYVGLRGRIIACVSILAGYWAVMTFAPIEASEELRFSEDHNFAAWVDSKLLPLRKYLDKPYDPEGILSNIPAIATCLLGTFAGSILQSDRRNMIKLLWLIGFGLVCLAAGWGWSHQFPVIKKIWTSSFVLIAGGWSFLLAAFFFALVDMPGWTRWATPLYWVGMNAITIYLLTALFDFYGLAERLAGGPISGSLEKLRPGLGNLLLSVVSLSLALLLCRFLYNRKIFLKV